MKKFGVVRNSHLQCLAGLIKPVVVAVGESTCNQQQDDESSEGSSLMRANTDGDRDSLSQMPVKDRYHLVFWIVYLLGLGALLPWNFFITAQGYWMYKLRNCNSSMPATAMPATLHNVTVFASSTGLETTTQSSVSSTRLQSLFMNSLAVCSMLPALIFQFLNTVVQKRISQNIRIVSSLAMVIVFFIFTEVLVKVDTCDWQNAFFFVTLVSVVLINSFSAIFQSSAFALAAALPQNYTGGFMAGQGVGGLFSAVAMIIALACSSGPTESALLFFLTAIVVLFFTIFSYVLLIRLDFYKYYMNTARVFETTISDFAPEESDDQRERLLPPESINKGGNYVKIIRPTGEQGYTDVPDGRTSSGTPFVPIAKKMAVHMFCVMYVFFVTLACFPEVTGKIKAQSSGTEWTDVYFTPVTNYLLFNLGDWIGRTTASYIHVPSSSHSKTLLFCVLLRTVFPFLFAVCNYQPRYNLPIWLHEDWMYIVVMIFFAISNGHLSTLSMQYGPKQVEPENSGTAGSMLAVMMGVGLLAGAGSSFLLTSWI